MDKIDKRLLASEQAAKAKQQQINNELDSAIIAVAKTSPWYQRQLNSDVDPDDPRR